jgi:peptide/nickel transport system substrate-binding protein
MADIGQQYLTFDQARDELQDSDVKGRNPFKDLRVRQAVYHAINVPLIVDKVLRGQAVPTGAFLSPAGRRLAARARQAPALRPGARARAAGRGRLPERLRGHAGLRERGLARERLPGRGGMLTQVGIRTTLRSSPSNQFFPKLSQGTASFIEYGWTATPDAWNSLNGLFRSFDPAAWAPSTPAATATRSSTC